jgi:hypothetical protein
MAFSLETLENLTVLMRKLDEVSRLVEQVRPQVEWAMAAARALELEAPPGTIRVVRPDRAS